ncbi:MAG: glycosyltransferase [Candidatus Eremiobacteraeota bacterium]|nr:glycosyltransferase [Candidatus Eremiobacteraeota bacterium]
MPNIVYSLLVPTRNRPATAECLIRHALSFFPDDHEIVVQDCGAAGPLSDALKDVSSDPRLRYEHTGRLVSMTDNWNRGFDRCRGEYMSVLGDDDGVTRELPNIIRWMGDSNIDMVVANWNGAMYYWPDFPNPTIAATYTMHGYTGDVVAYATSSLLRRAVVTLGYSDVRAMPCVYHGVVRRRYLTQMVERTGRCFNGYNPDFYSSFFLATIVPKTHWIDFPMFVAGTCGSSNSANALVGRLTDLHTREYQALDWPDVVPEGRNLNALVAESVVRALRNAGRADLVKTIQWPDFYLLCMLHDPAFRWRNLVRYWAVSGRVLNRSPLQRTLDLTAGFVRRVRGKLVRRQGYVESAFAAPKRDVFERYSGVRDTTEVVAIQADAMRRQGVLPPWRRPQADATVDSIVTGL